MKNLLLGICFFGSFYSYACQVEIKNLNNTNDVIKSKVDSYPFNISLPGTKWTCAIMKSPGEPIYYQTLCTIGDEYSVISTAVHRETKFAEIGLAEKKTKKMYQILLKECHVN